jgi:putative flippase GtrA
MVITAATGVATTWLTAKVMKELKLPMVAAPFVGAGVAMVVNRFASRWR